MTAADRSAVLGAAYALLHLIDFEEPFGYSVVEALACGTPVIAHRRGSMPELITDGVTGYLVDDAEAAVRAIHAAGSLDRHTIRDGDRRPLRQEHDDRPLRRRLPIPPRRRLTSGSRPACGRQAKTASAFVQMWVAPQCGQRTEFPVSTDR